VLKSDGLSAKDKVYYTKILTAFLAAFLCTILKLSEWNAFLLAIGLFALDHILLLKVLKVPLEEYDNSHLVMAFDTAITYYVLFIVSWALLYDIFWLT